MADLSDHSASASLQILEFENENDITVRSVLPVNWGPQNVWTHRLVALTGTRFLRTIVSTAESSVSRIVGLEFPAEEQQAASAVLAMIQGNAPEKLDTQQLRSILKMCRFCLADLLVEGFGGYLAAIVPQLDPSEVCSEDLPASMPFLLCVPV